MFHTQDDYLVVVALFVMDKGAANWPEIFAHVEATMNLTAADWEINGTNRPRWHQMVTNLASNGLMERSYPNMSRKLRGGFVYTAPQLLAA